MRTSDQLLQMLDVLLDHLPLYYDPPSGTMMVYPCIRVSESNLNTRNADNKKYLMMMSYTLTYITDESVDVGIDPVTSKLLDLNYCSFRDSTVVDGVHHYTFKIYY